MTPWAHSMRSPFQLTRDLIPSPSVGLSHLRAGHTLLDDVLGMNSATPRAIACAHHVAPRVIAPDVDGRLAVRRAVRLQASLIAGPLSRRERAFAFCGSSSVGSFPDWGQFAEFVCDGDLDSECGEVAEAFGTRAVLAVEVGVQVITAAFHVS